MDHSDSRDPNELLTEHEVAEMLRISVRTLQAWRTKKIGPRVVRLNRMVRYRWQAVMEWLRSKDENEEPA
jgi:predicted DNA-binding transcriptional regulator AlpA